jgi:hypothetical protein
MGIALAVGAFRAELERLHCAAPEAELLAGNTLLRQSLSELQLRYGDVRLAACRPDSHVEVNVGTDHAAENAAEWREARRMTTHQLVEVLSLGIASAMEIELRAKSAPCLFDVQRDVASLLCGRSVAAAVVRHRWPGVAICTLGAAAPVIVLFTVHWANGGLGQFALAYAWPLWLEVWICVGYSLFVGVILLWYSSMQRELAWLTLKQFSTLWIIAMAGVYIAGLVSLYVNVNRTLWVWLPVSIALVLFFPLVAMADALPPKLRLRVLRFAGPFALGCMGAVALVLRLPTAEGTPGKLVWTVMGTETVTNLQAITYSATVIAVLFTKGVYRAWVFPDQLAFIQTSMCVTELAAGALPSGKPRAARAELARPTSVQQTSSNQILVD